MRQAPKEDTGVDMISLPVKEAKRNRITFLLDTGATISIVKLKTLRDETIIEGDKN